MIRGSVESNQVSVSVRFNVGLTRSGMINFCIWLKIKLSVFVFNEHFVNFYQAFVCVLRCCARRRHVFYSLQ